MKYIYKLIEAIATEPSKNGKVELLKQNSSVELQEVLLATYDPTVTYGIKSIPTNTSLVQGYSESIDFDLLKKLSKRELTGHAAQDAIRNEMNDLVPESGELFKRILLKDLRAGFGAETINKAFPGLITSYAYQRCSLPEKSNMHKWDWSNGIYSQVKSDGMFINFNYVAKGDSSIVTRNGSVLPIEHFEDIVEAVEWTFGNEGGYQLHGELIVLQHIDNAWKTCPREIGNGILNSVLKGGEFKEGFLPYFVVWDCIPMKCATSKGKCDTPYSERFAFVRFQHCMGNQPIEGARTKIVYSLDEAYEHYGEMLAQGEEGTVLKNPYAGWKDGTSKDCVKLKNEFVCELRITGTTPGQGKNSSTFGSIKCVSECGKLSVNVSGFSDKQRKEIADNYFKDWHDTVISVKSNMSMKPAVNTELYSLFLPRFVEQRLDKTQADTLEEILSQEEAAKKSILNK